MPSFREQLLTIQRTVYRKHQKLINNTLSITPQIARYAQQYYKYLKNFETISSKQDLIRRVLSSNIVFHGDYHTLRVSQRSVFKILNDIVEKRKVVLCLEMFHGDDQRVVDQFLQGKISERSFLKKIQYSKKWNYKWENWKPIIDLCRKHSMKILGINSTYESHDNSLAERDQYSSRIIAKAHIRYPDELLYVVIGDYHISPNHLPHYIEELLQMFDITVKKTMIYQNAENLYWKLADKHLEETDVLSIDQDSFCIMNTTPVNKLQSYLNWLEFSDDAYYPIHHDWEESIEDSTHSSIPVLVERMCKILHMSYPREALERCNIFYGSNLEFMNMIENSENFKPILTQIRYKIKNNEGFLLEHIHNEELSHIIYLPNSNLNMAAEEAAHLLHSINRGIVEPIHNPFDRFYHCVITEAIGFFGSKLINEKRQALSQSALRRYVGEFKWCTPNKEQKYKINICRYLLQHRYLEIHSQDSQTYQKKFSTLYNGKISISREVATQLGYMLGDKLFSSVKRGKVPIEEVTNLFQLSLNKRNEAFQYYIDISSKTMRKKNQHQ